MSHFLNYYQNTIDTHSTGLKLVLGGTGLGKTSSIKTVLKQPENEGKSFIYIANRIQLLEELKDDLREEFKQEIFVHQRSDFEILLEIIKENGQDKLKELFDNDIIKNYFNYLEFTKNRISKIADVKKALNFIASNSNNLSFVKSSEGNELIRERTRIMMNFFKNIVRVTKQVKEYSISVDITNEEKEKYDEIELNKLKKIKAGFSIRDYDILVANAIILKLFPFIDFKTSNKKIFLVTLQKAFYGFFDGSHSVNLYHLNNDNRKKNGGNIIFLDEFDFLENDLISLLAKDLEINYPFKFVQEFYLAMTRNKLPYQNFLSKNDSQRQLKEDIDNVINRISQLSRDYGINYPEINHFICNEPKIKGKSIFQTRYTIFDKVFYLEEPEGREGTFNLTFERNKSIKGATAFVLFNTVNRSVAEIIRIFKEIEITEPSLYKSMMRYCFETSDTFQRILRSVKQYPLYPKKTDSNYDKLQYNGFGLYEIHDLQDEYDPDEVYLRYYAIFTTPEKVLLGLAKNNLVFGLSATAEIPRLVKNFDIRWLQEQLGNNYIEPSKHDIESCIQQANVDKAKLRENTIQVIKASSLNPKVELQKNIYGFIEEWVKEKPKDDFGNLIFGNGRMKHRQNRLKNFLSTLFWILENKNIEDRKIDTHLLFYSTFKQIKWFFDNKKDGTNRRLWNIEEKLSEKDGIWFSYYEINMCEQDFIVVFYDAEKGKDIQKESTSKQKYYGLFRQQKPVIVITQYASAGNGINLQYHSPDIKDEKMGSKKPEKDFHNIHLLDLPFYFFSKFEEDKEQSEKNATIKTNIYYLAKLLQANGGITKQQFKGYLGNIRDSGSFNRSYISTPDGMLGQLSIIIQALGRVERVWAKMENQTIRLEDSVYNVLEKFVTDKAYFSIRERLKNYFSNNLQEAFSQIAENYKKQGREIEIIKQEDLQRIDEACRESIRRLLDNLNLLRRNPNNPKANEWRREWNSLRDKVLNHDFVALEKYNCVFQTDYYDYIEKALWIDEDKNLVPKDKKNSNFKPWILNSVYDLVSQNDIITTHFELKFDRGFNNHGKFLTPYAYQCILSGAIGEESVKAILKKQDIELNDDEIPNELFEFADLKIKGKPFYIDAKNYSDSTLMKFSLDERDPLFHPKLNEDYFAKKAIEKLKQIQVYHYTKDAKLIYINAFGKEDRPRRYYDVIDDELVDVQFDYDKAKIIIIFGMLNKNEPNILLEGFQTFLNHLHNRL